MNTKTTKSVCYILIIIAIIIPLVFILNNNNLINSPKISKIKNADISSENLNTITRTPVEELEIDYSKHRKLMEENNNLVMSVKKKLEEFRNLSVQESCLRINNIPLSGYLLYMKYEQLTSLDINQVPWLNLKPKNLTKEQLENFKLFIESNKSVINSLLKAVEERQKTLIETNKSIPKFDIIQLSPKKENYDMLPYYVMSNTSITDVIITTIGGKNPGYHIFKYGLDSERDAMLYNIQSELIVLELQLQTYWNSIQ